MRAKRAIPHSRKERENVRAARPGPSSRKERAPQDDNARLGDAESELGGAGHEAQLGPLAAGLGLSDVDCWFGH